MFISTLRILILLMLWLVLVSASVCAMGGKQQEIQIDTPSLENVPKSSVTLKDLAHIYWPDTNATAVQQEEILKNLLGKSVIWEITVAQIQRAGNAYLVQGQSDKDTLGTFAYVTPRNDDEQNRILKAEKGSVLLIYGVVSDMRLRHIVLQPAVLSTKE